MATMFPQALGAQQGDPSQYADPYAAQIAAMRARMQQQQPPMYTPEQVEQRRSQNDREYQLGLLGQLSGDQGLTNVGGQVFKQALAARQPKITERGVADPITGQFNYDPEFLRQRDEQSLAGLEQKSASSRAAFDEQRTRAQERADRQREHDEATKEARAASAANGQVGAFQQSGFTPDGQNVVTNSKSGVNYIVTVGGDGTPNYKPYSGITTPKATYDKAVVSAQEQLGAADRADKLIGRIEKNPEAFGMRAAAVGGLPGQMQGWAAPALGLTRDQLNLRAQVTRDAAMELNKIYGAAQSAGELARAAAWAPNATDGLEAIITKLTAARDWANGNAEGAGVGVLNAARGRSGSPPGAPPAPPGQGGAGTGPLSPAEAAELAALRQRLQGRGP